MATSENTSPLPADWALPEAIRVRFGREAGPQRSILEDGNLLIVLHQLPGPDQMERVPAFFWRNESGVWQSSPGGPGLAGLENLLLSYKSRVLELERGNLVEKT